MLDRKQVQRELLKTAKDYEHFLLVYCDNIQLLNMDGSTPLVRESTVQNQKELVFVPEFQVDATFYRVTWVTASRTPPSGRNWRIVIKDPDGNKTKQAAMIVWHKKLGYLEILLQTD